MILLRTRRRPGRFLPGAVAFALTTAGCAIAVTRIPPDPGVTFAAHAVHAGLMVDEMQGGTPTLLRPPSWITLFGGPKLVVRDGPERGEALWLKGPGRATVRRGLTRECPLVGRIEPSWDNNSIQLAIEPANGPSLKTGVFRRAGFGGGLATLNRLAQLTIDVTGTYRATVRDSAGRAVGWLQVAVGPDQAPEIYEGVLPPEVDEGLAAASAAALSEEIDWIEAHAYDVYGTHTP